MSGELLELGRAMRLFLNRIAMFPIKTSFNLVLIIVVAFLGTACGSRTKIENPDGARIVAESFLAKIRQEKIEAVWNSTSIEFKSFLGMQQLGELTRQFPFIKNEMIFEEEETIQGGKNDWMICVFKSPKSPKKAKVYVGKSGMNWEIHGLKVE